MNSAEYISIINNPNVITPLQIEELGNIIDEYPYFQSARIVRLKGLYMQNSFKYNYALKVTAAHTTDRAVLLDLITSESFLTLKKRVPETESEDFFEVIEDDRTIVEEILIENPVKENTIKESILTSIKESSLITKDQMDAEIPKIREQKEETIVGNTPPVSFNFNEKHSFQEWLQLSSLKPIDRNKTTTVDKNSKTESKPIIAQVIPVENILAMEDEKRKKEKLIDQFIENSPKISPIRHVSAPAIQIDINKDDHSDLMTETLAKIYLEQKKYVKAIQAYEILILKYPEKSSYFVDCISDIKNLQLHN